LELGLEVRNPEQKQHSNEIIPIIETPYQIIVAETRFK